MEPAVATGGELFFEVQRRKCHVFLQAKEGATVAELKRMLEAILKIPIDQQQLFKPANEQRTEWSPMGDGSTLHELGFSGKNARAEEPAVIALLHTAEDGGELQPIIEPVSEPPPLPPAMAHRDSDTLSS